jgi:hypothetical protein
VDAITIYRVELAGGGVVFAENEPKPSGQTLVFRSSPQGILVALRRSEVARVERIEADNKPPVDFGKATLKRVATARPGALHAQNPLERQEPPAEEVEYRRYLPGDDHPGNRVAFPVSRDDLLPGNYRPFPAGPGGQSGDAPKIKEGRGVPKAGSLREPPMAIRLADPPATANIQVPAAPLVFSEKPHIDELLPAAAITARQ